MTEQKLPQRKRRGSLAVQIGSIGLAVFTIVTFANLGQSLISFSSIFSPMAHSSQSGASNFASASANLSLSIFLWLVFLVILIWGLVLKNQKPLNDSEPSIDSESEPK